MLKTALVAAGAGFVGALIGTVHECSWHCQLPAWTLVNGRRAAVVGTAL